MADDTKPEEPTTTQVTANLPPDFQSWQFTTIEFDNSESEPSYYSAAVIDNLAVVEVPDKYAGTYCTAHWRRAAWEEPEVPRGLISTTHHAAKIRAPKKGDTKHLDAPTT